MKLEYFDFLSPEITVFYFGKKRHTSSFGGILTLLMTISCVLYISYMLSKIFLHKSHTTNSFRKNLDDAGYYSFDYNGVYHYLQFHDSNKNSKYGGYNTKYIRIIMHRLYNSYNHNPSLLSENEHWVYGYCRKGIDISKDIEITKGVNFACLRYYYNNTIHKYFSIDDKNNYKPPYLIHGSGKSGSLFLTTVVEKCNNNSKINEIFNITCGTNDEINDFLNSYIGIYLNFLSHQVDTNNYTNPINSFYYRVSNELSSGRVPVNDINFSPLQVNSYSGIIINSLKSDVSYIFEENRKSVEDGAEFNNKILSIYNYWLQNNAQFFERRYKNFYDDVLPSIGGIIQVIFYLFYYINFIFNKYIINRDSRKLIFEWNKNLNKKKLETVKFYNLVKSLKIKEKNNHNFFTAIFKSKPKIFTPINDIDQQNNHSINYIIENKDDKIYHVPKTPLHTNKIKQKLEKKKEIDTNLRDFKNLKILNKKLFKRNTDQFALHENNNNNITTNNSMDNQKNKILASGTYNNITNSKIEDQRNSCSKMYLTPTNEFFKYLKFNNFFEENKTKKDNNSSFYTKRNEIKSSKSNLFTKKFLDFRNSTKLNESHSKFKKSNKNDNKNSNKNENKKRNSKNKNKMSLTIRKSCYHFDNSSINEFLCSSDYFSLLEYISTLFCKKKNNAIYILEKFRKRLISEEHLFKSNIYLYLIEKSFTLDSQKFNIVQLYENL